MENKLQVGVGEAKPVESRGPGIGAGPEQGGTRATHRCGHILFLAGLVPLALPCQPPRCQVCPGPVIPKLGVHPACWLLLLSPDGLVLN